MSIIRKMALGATAVLLCANFSMDQKDTSVSGNSANPVVNFKASIRDNTGTQFNAQNITISGLYKQIPLYNKPKNTKDENYNPTINTVRLDLAEIFKIIVPHP